MYRRRILCTQCEWRWFCVQMSRVHIGLNSGKGENGTKVLTELIVFFLPNYVNFQLKLTTIFFFYKFYPLKSSQVFVLPILGSLMTRVRLSH